MNQGDIVSDSGLSPYERMVRYSNMKLIPGDLLMSTHNQNGYTYANEDDSRGMSFRSADNIERGSIVIVLVVKTPWIMVMVMVSGDGARLRWASMTCWLPV